MTATRRLISLAVFLLALPGCGLRAVPDSDLIGRWATAVESRPLLSAYPISNRTSLTLRDDGTFAAVDIPGEMASPEKAWSRMNLTASGTWQRADRDTLVLNFRESAQAPAIALPFGATLFIRSSYDGVRLIFYRGDPDEGITIEFERVASSR